MGDELYIKEVWRVGAWDEDTGIIWIDYKADNYSRQDGVVVPSLYSTGKEFQRLWEQSCEDAEAAGVKPDADGQHHWEMGNSPCRWRSPMFMPQWAARRYFVLTRVWQEHLQDITEQDALAEGIVRKYHILDMVLWGIAGSSHSVISPKFAYCDLWDSINGKKPGCAWKDNPLVWCHEGRILNVEQPF